MILKPDKDGVFTISFLLLPEYAMVALLSAIEPLRVANRFAGREIFRWQLLSEDGPPVAASNLLALQQTVAICDSAVPLNIFVCSSFNPKDYIRDDTIAWLKKLNRGGSLIGAMDTGCYLLAAAGLLKKHKIALHWEAAPSFQEDHPELELTNELFEVEHNLITCAGGTSAIDMMLYIIQAELGHALAIKVCEQFIKSGIRQKSDKQRIDLSARLKVYHPRLLRVLEKMEANLESPLSTKELAKYAHISVRQMERLFRSFLNDSPSGYYMKLRLERSRQLLKESSLSISEIRIICGFNSAPHFTRSYRKQFARSPSEDR